MATNDFNIVASLNFTFEPPKCNEAIEDHYGTFSPLLEVNLTILSERQTHRPTCDMPQNSTPGYYWGEGVEIENMCIKKVMEIVKLM